MRHTFGEYRSSRTNNFNWIRFVLAMCVVLEHSWHAINRGLPNPTHGQVWLGHLAVNGFFCVSGLLVTASWERCTGLFDYLRKRVLRIYPGFVACWLVCILIVAPLSGLSLAEYRSQVHVGLWIAKMVFLRGFGGYQAFPHNPQPMLNASLWSISYEFGCYLMVAAFALLGSRRPRAIVGAALALWLLTSFGTLSFTTLSMPHGVRRLADIVGAATTLVPVSYFLLGAAFWVLMDRIVFSNRVASCLVVITVVAMRVPPMLLVVLPVTLPYLTFFTAYHPALAVLNGFGRRVDLSYGVYLYSWPIEQIVVQILGGSLPGIAVFVLATPAILVVAYLSWTFVEEPFLRFKKPKPAVQIAPGKDVATSS